MRLYNKAASIVAELPTRTIKRVFAVCVTLDHFGALQTDLSYLLKKEPDEDYPWAVNIYDLEHILGGMKHKGWAPDRLCQYLEGRMLLHGRLQTYDELEIAGYHLREETLHPFLEQMDSTIMLHPSYADAYTDILEELRGGPKADLSPQGSFFGDIRQFGPKFLNQEFLLGLPSPSENRESGNAARTRRVGRNDRCPCGSGKKYKKCCGFRSVH